MMLSIQHSTTFPICCPVLQIDPQIACNPSMLQQLLDVFFQEAVKQLHQLQEHVKLRQNLQQAQLLLHKMKGDSRSIGALHFAELTYRAEQAADVGEWLEIALLLPHLNKALVNTQRYRENTTE